MPIDPVLATGAVLPASSASWTATDVILYHLGIGAGVPPTDPDELKYTYENGLEVLASFASIPAFPTAMGIGEVEGLDLDLTTLLHGEQEIELAGPIPVELRVGNEGRIEAVYDKGKGALVVVAIESKDEAGNLVFTNRYSLFLRGEGGWGGDPGPPTRYEAPDRPPDHVASSTTLPQQALLYRLSGDRNPLHVDPGFAALGGFDRPILHGLCTYGIVCKAVVDDVLAGAGIRRYRARFSGVVFPGETIVTSVWDQGDFLVAEASTRERGQVVLGQAAIWPW